MVLAADPSWHSPEEFAQQLAVFRPAEVRDYFACLFAILDSDSSEDAKLGRIVFPDKVATAVTVWRGDERALVFGTASPPLQSTRAVAGVLFVMQRISASSWRVVDVRRFEALGQVAQLKCRLTSEVGTGSPALGTESRDVIVTIERQKGGRGYACVTFRSYRLVEHGDNASPLLEEFF
jgi:hypothetical protein